MASRSTATRSWQSPLTFPSWSARSNIIYRTHERRLTGNEGDDPHYRPGCCASGVRSSISSYFATRPFAQHDLSAETTFGAKSSTGRRGSAAGHWCYTPCDSERESATDAESIGTGEIRHCRRKCCAESGCAREVGRHQAPGDLILISRNRVCDWEKPHALRPWTN